MTVKPDTNKAVHSFRKKVYFRQFSGFYASVNMKKVILEVLGDKGSLSEKKLRKYTLKKVPEGENNEEEFDSALASLTKKGKVVLEGDEYKLPTEDDAGAKRKRSGSESHAAESSEPVAVKKVKESKSKADAASKLPKYEELWKNGEKHWREGTFDPEYLRTNPDKVTRLFCGNLNKKITEEQLKERLPGLLYIKWITDKSTGEFYGSSFLEMKDAASAALAVLQDKTKFLGRPMKLYYCPPRPGDKWPPHPVGSNNGNPNDNPDSSSAHSMTKAKTNEPPRREKTEKPEGCRKLFAGNLSYNIDDETIVDFFKECGTLIGLRWLTRKETEEFRGAGYIEFSTAEEADAAMKLDGKELLGRNIRLDWTN